MTRAAPSALEHLVLLAGGRGQRQQSTPMREPDQETEQRSGSGEKRGVFGRFAHLREVVEDVAGEDADDVLHDGGAHEQGEGHQHEGHVESLHRDSPEGARRGGVLLAPEVDAVLQKRHAQQVAGIHECHQLRVIDSHNKNEIEYYTPQHIENEVRSITCRTYCSMPRFTLTLGTAHGVLLKTGAEGHATHHRKTGRPHEHQIHHEAHGGTANVKEIGKESPHLQLTEDDRAHF